MVLRRTSTAVIFFLPGNLSRGIKLLRKGNYTCTLLGDSARGGDGQKGTSSLKNYLLLFRYKGTSGVNDEREREKERLSGIRKMMRGRDPLRYLKQFCFARL